MRKLPRLLFCTHHHKNLPTEKYAESRQTEKIQLCNSLSMHVSSKKYLYYYPSFSSFFAMPCDIIIPCLYAAQSTTTKPTSGGRLVIVRFDWIEWMSFPFGLISSLYSYTTLYSSTQKPYYNLSCEDVCIPKYSKNDRDTTSPAPFIFIFPSLYISSLQIHM